METFESSAPEIIVSEQVPDIPIAEAGETYPVAVYEPLLPSTENDELLPADPSEFDGLPEEDMDTETTEGELMPLEDELLPLESGGFSGEGLGGSIEQEGSSAIESEGSLLFAQQEFARRERKRGFFEELLRKLFLSLAGQPDIEIGPIISSSLTSIPTGFVEYVSDRVRSGNAPSYDEIAEQFPDLRFQGEEVEVLDNPEILDAEVVQDTSLIGGDSPLSLEGPDMGSVSVIEAPQETPRLPDLSQSTEPIFD